MKEFLEILILVIFLISAGFIAGYDIGKDAGVREYKKWFGNKN